MANESELQQLAEEAASYDILVSVFREPDVDNQITAIALAPHPKSKKLCSRIPLALRNK